MTEIEHTLKVLRLSGMRATLETRALQVTQGDATFLEGVAHLLQDELDRRRSRLSERRLKQSGLMERTLLGEFDGGFNPKLPKKSCFELVALGFIQRGEHALRMPSSCRATRSVRGRAAQNPQQDAHPVLQGRSARHR